jgi:hypothetical protein
VTNVGGRSTQVKLVRLNVIQTWQLREMPEVHVSVLRSELSVVLKLSAKVANVPLA